MRELTIENGSIFLKNGYIKSNINELIKNKINDSDANINNIKMDSVIKSGLLYLGKDRNNKCFIYKMAEGYYNFHIYSLDEYVQIYMPELYFMYARGYGLFISSKAFKIWPYYNAYSGHYSTNDIARKISEVCGGDHYDLHQQLQEIGLNNRWVGMCVGESIDLNNITDNIPFYLGTFLSSPNNHDLSCRADLNSNINRIFEKYNLYGTYEIEGASINIVSNVPILRQISHQLYNDDMNDRMAVLSHILSGQKNKQLMIDFWSSIENDDY